MSSLAPENTIITVPIGSALGGQADQIDIRLGTFDEIEVGSNFQSESLSVSSSGFPASITATSQIKGNTTDTASADLYTFTPTNNTVSYVTLTILAVSQDADFLVIKRSYRMIVLEQAITLGAPFDIQSSIDAALAGVTVDFVIDDTRLIIRATGVLGKIIQWGATLQMSNLAYI